MARPLLALLLLPFALAVESPADDAAKEQRPALARLGVDRWHAHGGRGAGVKVAVLDTGFRGYRDFLGRGLPADVRVRSFRRDGNLEARDSQHGILCAEVIHALAPDAELLFANWEPDCPRAFLDAVRWARDEGARVISCSVIMPSWSDGDGGGAVHEKLAALLGPGDSPADLVFCASAGNTAQRHWSGPLHPDAAGWHEWRPGQPETTILPWGQDRVTVELYGTAHAPVEAEVLDATTRAVVARATLQHDAELGGPRAVLRFDPAEGTAYRLRLRVPPRMTADPLHVVVLGGWLEAGTRAGSIPFPADGGRVLAVGAVDDHGQRLLYSSCGPNARCPKPDLVAPVPFPSRCRSRPFAGTSAAAPQVAALAALLLSRHPDGTPAAVSATLRNAATDVGPRGHDDDTGYGMLRLP